LGAADEIQSSSQYPRTDRWLNITAKRNLPMNDHPALLKTLTESETYRRYERAFCDATGLPLALRPVEAWQPPFRGKARENKFCAMMARHSAACAACLQMQERLAQEAEAGPAVLKCHFGMSEAAVPVKLGREAVGFLTTGQVLTQVPNESQLARVDATLDKLGVKVDRDTARTAYRATRVMPRSQLVSTAHLLMSFADHLSAKSNELAIHQAHAEPVPVTRAREYIRQKLEEDISLDDIARAACTSRFYICKLFKRYTGLNFTEYVCRLRIERAKELLLKPNLRVSEIAFEVGFQSLTHFNRVFRDLLGESPTAYREKLALPAAA
jgi:AraC-like DNA-binding protein